MAGAAAATTPLELPREQPAGRGCARCSTTAAGVCHHGGAVCRPAVERPTCCTRRQREAQEALQVKTVLRKLTSHAVTRSPEEPLLYCWAGGGGVAYPPRRQPCASGQHPGSPRCQDGEDMSAAPTPTWNASHRCSMPHVARQESAAEAGSSTVRYETTQRRMAPPMAGCTCVWNPSRVVLTGHQLIPHPSCSWWHVHVCVQQ